MGRILQSRERRGAPGWAAAHASEGGMSGRSEDSPPDYECAVHGNNERRELIHPSHWRKGLQGQQFLLQRFLEQAEQLALGSQHSTC